MPIPTLLMFGVLLFSWNVGLIGAPLVQGLISSYVVAALVAVTLLLIYDGTEMRSKKSRLERRPPASTFGAAPTPSHV